MKFKNIAFILLSTFTLVSCGGDPTPSPSPTPTYPIDFDINPVSDNNITINKSESKTISIAFDDPSYKSNYKDIEWTINSSYVSKESVSSDKMSCTINAVSVSPVNEPAELTVKVTAKNNTVKEKTCYIDVRELPIEKELTWDNEYHTYKEEGTFRKGIKYRFTGSINANKTYTYFGMSEYIGDPPYFDIGYNKPSQKVNVTAIYIDNGIKTEIDSNKIHENSYYKVLYVGGSTFKKDNKIIVECTINETITSGFWAYAGSN